MPTLTMDSLVWENSSLDIQEIQKDFPRRSCWRGPLISPRPFMPFQLPLTGDSNTLGIPTWMAMQQLLRWPRAMVATTLVMCTMRPSKSTIELSTTHPPLRIAVTMSTTMPLLRARLWPHPQQFRQLLLIPQPNISVTWWVDRDPLVFSNLLQVS